MTAHLFPVARSRSGRLSRDMRTLLLGGICIAGMLAVGKGIPWLISSRRATVNELRINTLELARDRQIVSHRNDVVKSIDRTTTSFLGLSPGFLKGEAASQAAAMLSSVVTDAADANGVHLSSLQPQFDSSAHSLIVPVVVHASGTGDVRGVSGMLRDLESGVPLVDVRQITIAQPDPTASADRMEALHVELTVRGLFRGIPGVAAARTSQ